MFFSEQDFQSCGTFIQTIALISMTLDWLPIVFSGLLLWHAFIWLSDSPAVYKTCNNSGVFSSPGWNGMKLEILEPLNWLMLSD